MVANWASLFRNGTDWASPQPTSVRSLILELGTELAIGPGRMVPVAQRRSTPSNTGQILAIAASLLFVSVSVARAQQPAAESNEQHRQAQLSERLAEDSPSVPRITTKARFSLATQRSFAPYL